MAGIPSIDPRKMFRERAFKKHLAGENPDELLFIVPSYFRFAVIYLTIVSVIIILWLFFGALTVEIKGKGVFMSRGGLFSIESQSFGFVKEIYHKPGDFVEQGDPIALLYDPKQEISLEFAEEELKLLRADYQNLKAQIQIEDEGNRASINQQIESNQFKIARIETQLPQLEKDYERKKALLEEHLISTTALLEAEKLLIQRRNALEAAKATIASLQARLAKTYRAEELKAMEEQLVEKKESLDLLKMTMQYNIIVSPIDAVLLESLVRTGDVVTLGKKIFWIEASNEGSKRSKNDAVIYAFVYMEIGKRIPIGQKILIQPVNINAQDYGSLIGHVVRVSPSSVSSKEIETYIHSKGLENYLVGGAPSPFLVTIQPELDPNTPSGYKWTTGTGAPFEISTGSISTISGIAFYERPIVRLIPLWRIELFLDESKKWLYSWIE